MEVKEESQMKGAVDDLDITGLISLHPVSYPVVLLKLFVVGKWQGWIQGDLGAP